MRRRCNRIFRLRRRRSTVLFITRLHIIIIPYYDIIGLLNLIFVVDHCRTATTTGSSIVTITLPSTSWEVSDANHTFLMITRYDLRLANSVLKNSLDKQRRHGVIMIAARQSTVQTLSYYYAQRWEPELLQWWDESPPIPYLKYNLQFSCKTYTNLSMSLL